MNGPTVPKIGVRQRESVTVLDLPPRLVRGNGAEEFRQTVERLVASGRVRILLNMERVTFIDTSGMGEFVACQRKVTGIGGSVKLLKPTARILDLLAITGLAGLFEPYQDETEAVGSF